MAEGEARLMNKHELGRLFDCTARWIERLTAEHGMPREPNGLYSAARCARWYVFFLREALDRRDTSGELAREFRRDRVRLAKVKAARAEMELKKLRSEFAPAEVVERHLREFTERMDRRWEEFVERIVPELEGLGRLEIRVKLDAAVREELAAIAAEGEKQTAALKDEAQELRRKGERPN